MQLRSTAAAAALTAAVVASDTRSGAAGRCNFAPPDVKAPDPAVRAVPVGSLRNAPEAPTLQHACTGSMAFKSGTLIAF